MIEKLDRNFPGEYHYSDLNAIRDKINEIIDHLNAEKGERCPECEGKGQRWNGKCLKCAGKGYTEVIRGYENTCPKCHGTGKPSAIGEYEPRKTSENSKAI